jgi:pimeloyl-ACP methyl ester carboxylesterase
MPIAPANGIEICYDEFGSPDAPALLLIRGFTSQMISWHVEFCERLAAHGLRVIRFDNRDVGLSTKFDEAPQYTLDDMAADGIGLLDHLGIGAAHIAGMSMGGMIAQLMAINHPDRVLSLASIMSHVGDADAVPPTPEAAAIFLAPPVASKEEFVEKAVRDRRVIGSPGFPFDEIDVREIAARSYDRCYLPQGNIRQALAIRSAPPRSEALLRLAIPVTVIHGTADPLIPVDNGRRTAAAIPACQLVEIDGMGHDIPRGAWDLVIGAIVDNIKRVAA